MRRALEVWILVMVSRNVLRSIDSRVTQEEELDQWAMAGRPRISCHLGDVAEEGRKGGYPWREGGRHHNHRCNNEENKV